MAMPPTTSDGMPRLIPTRCLPARTARTSLLRWQSEAFRVIPGDYVTTEDGAGIVHVLLPFGADDAKVAKDACVPTLFLINKKGETRPNGGFARENTTSSTSSTPTS